MAEPLLDPAELDRWTAEHPEWEVAGGRDRLSRRFDFGDFAAAMAFMAAVAPMADHLNHHPEWRNVYDKVWVELSTHDSGGLTALDLRLADAMDSLASS